MGKPTNTSKFYFPESNKKKNQKKNKFLSDKQEKELQSFFDSQCSSYPSKKAYIASIKSYSKEPKQFLEEKKTQEELTYENLGISMKNKTKTQRKESLYSDTESTSNEEKNENEKENVQKTPFEKNKEFHGTKKDFDIKQKTELCRNFMMKGECKYGDKCAYAHGYHELRAKVTNTTAFRTKNCKKFFENGYCPYGSRCQFRHQFKSNIINNPYDETLMTYSKILETLSKKENIPNIKKLVEKPRLKVFESLAPNNDNIPSTLLDDIKEIIH